MTAEREAQDVEYAAAVRADNERGEEERQREEAERALAEPIQIDVVRAARLQRLAPPPPPHHEGGSLKGGGTTRKLVRGRWRDE
eukprot:COSAG05_NODE_105_length_18793_cov_115.346421_6_plen_84_part_00